MNASAWPNHRSRHDPCAIALEAPKSGAVRSTSGENASTPWNELINEMTAHAGEDFGLIAPMSDRHPRLEPVEQNFVRTVQRWMKWRLRHYRRIGDWPKPGRLARRDQARQSWPLSRTGLPTETDQSESATYRRGSRSHSSLKGLPRHDSRCGHHR